MAESAPVTQYVGTKRKAKMKRATAKKVKTIYGY
jgi:hypothetical protein